MKTFGILLVVVLIAAGAAAGYLYLRPAPAEAAEASGAAADSAQVDIAPLAADLDAMRQRLDSAVTMADSLRLLLDEQRQEYEDGQADATSLAATLNKLDEDDMMGVVQRLDGRSFTQLYEASTARNQARLLGALKPEQAASFIRLQLPGGRARAIDASAPKDSTESS